jgi:hypothetical protein
MTVEYRNGKWCTVHCSGKDKGKTIACFPTKEDAEGQHAAIMANKIEIDLTMFQKVESRKAWQVIFAEGRAVQHFEDEADADYFINTSKNKSWFTFVKKQYAEVTRDKKTGRSYRVHPKGTKITFKQTSKD